MASSKDQPASRPVSGSFPRLSTSGRQHSGSLSLSATNSNHRINRRKSVNASASSTAHAAIAAALRETGDASAFPLSSSHRRSIGSKKATESQSMSARPSMHTYFGPGVLNGQDTDALEDNSMDEDIDPMEKDFTKNRNRRASEGSQLLKGGSKKGELRCETCGKGYKHSSCLTKHMWEHDPAWAVTSKLLISKHQQVQLLEAASVLCTMNVDSPPANGDLDVVHIDHSEGSSGSPVYSGSSEMQDEVSSAETTPPPMSEASYPVPDVKRLSNSSTNFSRSYRSVASSSFADSIASPGLPPQRFSGVDFRPTTSGTDDGNLAAATAGLTFAGTPKSRPSIGSNDVPPVPPLPQQYQSFSSKSSNSTLTNVYNPLVMQPPALTQQLSDERNYREDVDERKDSFASRQTQLEDEGMFRMDQ